MEQLPSPVHLSTERLVLTMPAPSDAGRMLSYFERNRRHLAPWEPPRADEFYTLDWWRTRLADNRREHAEDHSLRLALFPRGVPERPVIGVVNFTSFIRGAFHACLLGYSLDAGWVGRGIMREALQASTAYAFDELGIHRIMANYMPHNRRSASLLSRLGFDIEGLARDYLYIDGDWQDHILTSLSNPRWKPPA